MDTQPLSTMSKEEYMALAERKYHDLQPLKSKPTLYEYEKSFEQIWQDLGRQVFEKNLSDTPADRRKKKDDKPIRSDTNS